jgi:hypothetical protein
MTMKDMLLHLIQEDIRITGLVQSLGKLHIDATPYLLDVSSVVFGLLGLDPNDDVVDGYLKRVESGADLNNKEERIMLSQLILAFLEQQPKSINNRRKDLRIRV